MQAYKRLIQTEQNSAQYDQKWRHFKPNQQDNVDQLPFPFSYECRNTYETPERIKNMGQPIKF